MLASVSILAVLTIDLEDILIYHACFDYCIYTYWLRAAHERRAPGKGKNQFDKL